MKIRDLRAVYNALPSLDRVANHLPPCVVYEETDFGELAIDRSALVALDLDNLFSGRHTGEAVEAAVLRAIDDAASAADPEAPVVYVNVRFGTLHTARLVMRQTGEGVCVLAAIPCHVTADCDRFDVRVGGVTYLGAALHGAGGLLARGMSPEAFTAYWRRRQTRDTHPTLVHVVATATQSETVTAHPRDVVILRVWPVTPHA